MDYMKYSSCYRPLLPVNDQPLCDVGSPTSIPKASPDSFAKQITIIELSLFKAIKREEFSSLKWNGKEKHIHAPNIVASTRWFNQLNFWVQKEILKLSVVSKRTDVLAFFIRIAKKLVDHNNLYSAMSIVSALQVECIYRLRDTWGGLSNKDRTAYRNLEELFSQEDNCYRQREHMKSISLPGIPYLGLYLSDLTYTNVAHPRVGGKLTDIWVSKINALIDTIVYFQQSDYPFVIDDAINSYLRAQKYIEELQKFIEEDNYRTSLRLEPPPESLTEPPFSLCHSFNEKNCISRICGGESPQRNACSLSVCIPPRDTYKPTRGTCTSTLKNPNFDVDFAPHYDGCLNSGYSELQTTHDLARPSCAFVSSTEKPNPRPRFTNSHSTADVDQVDLKTFSCKSELRNHLHDDDGQAFVCSQLSRYQFCNTSFTPDRSDIRHLPPIPPKLSCGQNLKTSTPQSDVPLCPDIPERSFQAAVHPHLMQSSPQINAQDLCNSCLTPDACDRMERTTLTSSLSLHSDASTNRQIAPTPYCSMVLSASAVCAAAVAKETESMTANETQSEYSLDRKRRDSSHEAVLPVDGPHSSTGVTVSTTAFRELDSVSDNHLTPLPSLHQYTGTLLGVHVVHQGVVQRRLMSQSLGSLDTLTQLFGSRVRLNPLTSLSSFTSPSHTWSQARPVGFSPWRRFWATLVVVGSGSAAFIIYFSATSKSSISRDEFEARHCEIQPLLNMSTNSMTSFSIWRSEDAFRRNSLEPLSAPSPLSVKPAVDRSPAGCSHFSPSLQVSQLDIGRHRDGSIDPTSFLLLDACSRNVYRFRPINDGQRSHSSRTSTGPFGWLRRGGLRDSKVTSRVSQSVTPDLIRTALVSSPDTARRCIHSIPSPSILSACPSYSSTATLNVNNRHADKNSASEWLHLLSLVLSQLRLVHARDSIS